MKRKDGSMIHSDDYSDWHSHDAEVRKAEWILKNGQPKNAWIYERVDDTVYRRPIPADGHELPPWINKEREVVGIRDRETNTFKETKDGKN